MGLFIFDHDEREPDEYEKSIRALDLLYSCSGNYRANKEAYYRVRKIINSYYDLAKEDKKE